ncbi:MAG: transposase [Verrucomicrobia bacterium]|nr:transposase [Verrucomicrobiota bacterium]
MGAKRYKAEEIILKLREADVEPGRGKSVPDVCRQLGVTVVTYYRWRKEYNAIRPHSSLKYRPPAPAAVQPEVSGATPLHLPVGIEQWGELT